MDSVNIIFPDGSSKDFKKGITGLEIAKGIAEGLARNAVAIKVDENLWDLSRPINHNAKIKIITFKDPEGVEVFRHSTAHIMADAVVQLFPYAKPTIGPAVAEGFYYDFDHEPFKPEDLEKIEKKMQEIIKQDLKFERREVSKKEALLLFKDNQYKIEMINELKEDTLTIYQHGNYIDFCRGPHVQHTGQIKAVKLTKIAGAYWRGDNKNKMLQRVYGISFPDKKDLNGYLTLLEEASKRDHRKIGRDMDLFSFHDEAPGMPFIHAKGMVIWNELLDFWRAEHKKAGYVEIKTPIILNKALWLQSGHWDHYKENMYFTKIDQADYAVKPMNCPGGMITYKSRIHSYKELPLRAAEVGLVHRHELSGVLSGLFRVRCFHQDDAHLYVTEDQLENEIKGVVKLIDHFYKDIFGFEYHVELSTKPDKAMGDPKLWELAEKTLEKSLNELKMPFKINPGDGAFYGPKIDFHIKDSLGRTWQCATCQLDFQMPERFDLTYEGQDGKKHRPVMLHRVVYGSIERFLGILTEHFAGRFPLWLSPIQISILTVSDKFNGYAEKLMEKMSDYGLRVELDTRAESIPKKVRDAQLKQINYILVVGEKEEASHTVAVRTREGLVSNDVKADDLIERLLKEIKSKKLPEQPKPEIKK
ncbi:MAG: threonine--tRNA ligase [Candidatus Woesearchaeota archaeon]